MQYRENYMPITCGAFNSMPIPRPFQGMPQGTQQTMSPQVGGTGMIPPIAPLPTGIPAGGAASTAVPTGPQGAVSGGQQTAVPGFTPAPTSFTMSAEQIPVTVASPLYTPGFLRTQIGRKMRVEFLIGTNNLTDRTGTLVAVGASYILLRLIDSDDLMLCDIYSIKFVTIIL